VTTLTPRAFRKRLKDELLATFEQARHLADEYEWSWNATHSPTVGDTAHTRSYASDPTGAVALNGYGQPVEAHETDESQRDRILRGKAALRRQVDKSSRHALLEIGRLSNTLDGESKKLERAMGHIKPGASVRNPRFEAPIRGDMKLPPHVIRDLEAAQGRRHVRGEGYGGG